LAKHQSTLSSNSLAAAASSSSLLIKTRRQLREQALQKASSEELTCESAIKRKRDNKREAKLSAKLPALIDSANTSKPVSKALRENPSSLLKKRRSSHVSAHNNENGNSSLEAITAFYQIPENSLNNKGGAAAARMSGQDDGSNAQVATGATTKMETRSATKKARFL